MSKSKNTGLGRGLDAIFMDNSAVESGENVSMLRIYEIEPNPDQPRRDFDQESLAQLADSISAHGLIQPIVVRYTKNEGHYEIVAGERRWRASKMAGLSEVPVIIMDLDDKKAAQISLIENVQRENLNAMEEALAYNALLEEYDMTQEDISKQIGKSRSAVANTLRLLDLPDSVKEMVKNGTLSAGHARTLLGIKDADKIPEVAEAAVKKGLSVRALESLVRSCNKFTAALENGDSEEKPDPTKVDYTAELARKMSARLGKRVKIYDKGKVKKIEIQYSENEDLELIIKKLCGDNIFDE